MSGKILLVGFACKDICFLCERYPAEDSFTRLHVVLERRGGNASNSCTALRQLGAKCQLLTYFGDDDIGKWVKDDLAKIEVDLTHCPEGPHKEPVTYVIMSEETGSRTMLQWKNVYFPEPTVEDFKKIDLSEFSWVHFEGRNFEQTKKMISHVREWNASRKSGEKLRISLEIEQEREEIKELLPLGDVLIVSKDFALYQGYKSMDETILKLKDIVKPGATIVVPWGEQGAMAYLPDGTTFTSAAFSPPKVKDTVAAGDTFIGALVFSLSRKDTIQEAVTFACRVAGAKVGIMGFEGLSKLV